MIAWFFSPDFADKAYNISIWSCEGSWRRGLIYITITWLDANQIAFLYLRVLLFIDKNKLFIKVR